MPRSGPPEEVLAGTCRWYPRVTSWLGATLLAATIPIVSGRVTAKADQDVPETLTLTVPRWAAPAAGSDVIDWRPGKNARHPLARYGQRLDVTVIVESLATGTKYETRIGRFLIRDWEDDDSGTVSVSADGLLKLAETGKLGRAMSPVGSLASEARRLLPAGMGVSFDTSLEDRACPRGMAWSDDRLSALQEIASAWPALLRTDEWGQFQFRAPLPDVPVPVLEYKDGVGGTLIGAPMSDTREGVYNRVIASSSNSDVADVQASASVTAGPMNVRGDYGVVTKKWSSPLITDRRSAERSAQTMRDNSIRAAQTVPVRIAPDPRPDLDDAVVVKRGGNTDLWGWITGYDMPLTQADGDMRIDVGVAA